jgi:hypothetical protein
MRFEASITLNLKIPELTNAVIVANTLAMRDMVVDIWHEAVKTSPPPPKIGTYKPTMHNRKSIVGEVSHISGEVIKGSEAEPERQVDDSQIEGAVYSTSGYGGYLETGTWKMRARPYFKPALDKNFTLEKFAEKVKEHLK